jgi:uncharacterized repeat protein (TIGR01451 family)
MTMRCKEIFLAVMMVLPLFTVGPSVADDGRNISVKTDYFGTGSKDITLDFPGQGTRQDANISLQTGMLVDNATMHIQGSPHTVGGRDCGRNVTVDVGANDLIDWAYIGQGYGQLGNQDEFVSGAPNSSMKFGLNETNSSYFYVPKGANIVSANCTLNGSPAPVSVMVSGGANPNSWPFQGQQSFRIQWLYTGAEIGRSGIIDKVGWLFNAGTVPLTCGNFRLTLCNTTVNSLTTTFANNYGGATPVTLIDTASQVVDKDANNWVMFDVPNDFYYDNTKNLLTEIQFTSRSGTGFTICYQSMGTNRRAFGYPDTATTATMADGSRYNFRADFISNFNMSVDVCNDTVIDYTNSTPSWNGTELVFTQALSNFMATASINFTDSYGISFVTIPMAIYMEFGGSAIFSNLSIVYDYNALICDSPNTGNLTQELNLLMPKDLGTTNFSIPIKVSTETAGKVRLFSLSITAHPPAHAPTIVGLIPVQDIGIFENSTLEMGIDCIDIYNNPLTYQWFRNGTNATNCTTNRYNFTTDYESSGKHTVKVVVDNGLANVSFQWNITVKNVNRGPYVASFFPLGNATINENTSLEFRVNGSDPDRDMLRYAWFVNGNEKLGISTNYMLFTTDYSSSGSYNVRAQVMDPGGLSVNKTWTLNVSNVNLAPKIDAYNPRTNPKIKETEAVTFSVMASDYDKQTLTYRWYLNDTEMTSASQYTYRADFESAGNYTVRAVVSDGELNATHDWVLTVENVNRLPIPAIDLPKEPLEFMDTERISFSAKSSKDPDGDILKFRWYEAGKDLSTERDFEKTFAAGEHEVTLEVSDGNGGMNSTSIKFVVRFIKLSAVLAVDTSTPTADDIVTLTVTVSNMGDAVASPVMVEFVLDNRTVESKQIDSIDAGGADKTTFTWKSVKGDHQLTARLGNDTFNSTITVKAKLLPSITGGNDSWLWLIIAVVAVCAGVGVGAVVYRRRKKAKAARDAEMAATLGAGSPYAQQPGAAGYQTAAPSTGPSGPAPYTPVTSAPAQPQAQGPAQQGQAPAQAAYVPIVNQEYSSGPNYPTAPTAQVAPTAPAPQPAPKYSTASGPAVQGSYGAAPAASYAAPAAAVAIPSVAALSGESESEQQQKKAINIINQVSELVSSLERSGIDIGDARNSLDLAKSFVKARNPTKAIQYARKADVLARAARDRGVAPETSSQGQTKSCPDCGATMELSWKACPGCGRRGL